MFSLKISFCVLFVLLIKSYQSESPEYIAFDRFDTDIQEVIVPAHQILNDLYNLYYFCNDYTIHNLWNETGSPYFDDRVFNFMEEPPVYTPKMTWEERECLNFFTQMINYNLMSFFDSTINHKNVKSKYYRQTYEEGGKSLEVSLQQENYTTYLQCFK